jgi:hypothetical protein
MPYKKEAALADSFPFFFSHSDRKTKGVAGIIMKPT